MFPPQYHYQSSISFSFFFSLVFFFSPTSIHRYPALVSSSLHLCTSIASAANPRFSVLVPAFFLVNHHNVTRFSLMLPSTFQIPGLSIATLFTAKTLADSVRFYFGPRPDYLPPVPWLSIIHTHLGRVVCGGDIVRPQCQDLDISGKYGGKYSIPCPILSASLTCASTIRYAPDGTSSKPVWHS